MKWRRAVGLAVLLVLIGGCKESVDSDGPLELGGDSGSLCFGPNRGARYTVGGEVPRNRGETTVTINRVTLVDPQEIELIEAVVTPAPTPKASGVKVAIGVWDTYPPEGVVNSPEWLAREPAEGARIPAGEEREIIVGVAVLGPNSLAEAVQVEYTDGSGKRFVTRSTTKIMMRAHCGKGAFPTPSP